MRRTAFLFSSFFHGLDKAGTASDLCLSGTSSKAAPAFLDDMMVFSLSLDKVFRL